MPDKTRLEAVFEQLESCVALDNPNPAVVTPLVLELGELTDANNRVPDQLLDRLLDFLAKETVLKSSVAGLILQFFGFQLLNLTKRQRKRCLEGLRVLANRFEDGDAICEANRVCDSLLIANG